MSQTLSRYRYAFGKTEQAPAVPRGGWQGPISQTDGLIFGAMLYRLQLDADECAEAWQVPVQELTALIAGRTRFATTDDLDCTLKQLWLWHMERRSQKLASDTGGTWTP